MSSAPLGRAWGAEQLAGAERVPVWTRAVRPTFTGTGPGFAAWGKTTEPVEQMAETPPIDPFAEGFTAGYAAGEAVFDEERAALQRLAVSLRCLQPEPPADLASLLAATVRRLVTQIVGEVALDQAAIEHRSATIAALIAEQSDPARLRLPIDDAARLDGAALPVELVADPSLRPGEMVIETATGWIEDGPAIRLDRLRTALDAMAGNR